MSKLDGSSTSVQRFADLSDRHTEIAQLVAAGLHNKEIAAQLYLSTHTVRNHLALIYARLGIGTRLELARIVWEQSREEQSA